MCVIIHKPAGKPLYKKRLNRLWTRNPDGGGISYIDPVTKTIQTVKRMKWEDFWQEFRDINKAFGNEVDIVLHMRIATHGSVCLENTHPFQVDEHTVVAHNGIFSKYSFGDLPKLLKEEIGTDDLSDTRLFIHDILRSMPEDWLDNPGLVRLVKEYIGINNKLLFLTTNPALKRNLYIFNYSAGSVVDGLWFSNRNGVDEPQSTGYWTEYGKKLAAERKALPVPNTQRRTAAALLGDDEEYNEWLEEWQQWSGDYQPQSESVKKATGKKQYNLEKEHLGAPMRELETVTLTGTAEEMMLLKARKFGLGLVTPIIPKAEGWECAACENRINAEDYYCACWDVICTTCLQLCGACNCSDDGIPEATMLYSDYLLIAEELNDTQKPRLKLSEEEMKAALRMAL